MVISLEEIDRELFKADSIDDDSDFVAVAVYINPQGEAHHSGLVISYNKVYYLFHYGGSDIELREFTSGRFFCKKVKFITHDEVLAFYVHCLTIHKTANPTYGFFFTGDYYDKEGKYFSESGLEEYMTCVGFCISVVKGFIEGNDYYIYEDWNEEDVPNNFFEYFISQLRQQDPQKVINEELYRKHLRRISPVEYTSGAYLNIPVRKVNVDEIVETVMKVLTDRQNK